MQASAFCPAHITGFFKAIMVGSGGGVLEAGSMGAGFSISRGVRTAVDAAESGSDRSEISVSGYATGDTAVSERVVSKYRDMIGRSYEIKIRHEIGVPVGYGLGCSAAAALSLSLALNAALGTRLSRVEAAQVAHAAEIECRTGLGDVSGALNGGFEIRTEAGAPGFGRVERSDSDLHAVLACLAPMSTKKFISEDIGRINGLGGRMVAELAGSSDRNRFADMSARFARHIDVITPPMREIMDRLGGCGIRSGVALFGQTVFALVGRGAEGRVLEIIRPYGGLVVSAGIDNAGARLE